MMRWKFADFNDEQGIVFALALQVEYGETDLWMQWLLSFGSA